MLVFLSGCCPDTALQLPFEGLSGHDDRIHVRIVSVRYVPNEETPTQRVLSEG